MNDGEPNADDRRRPAQSRDIRANWWPDLGPDMGPPRLMDWSELTQREIGEAFGISQQTTNAIINKRNWKYI